jgi:hypothetical protein
MITFEDWTHGENPPNGASLNYWLGSSPEGDVKIRIDNAAGETVRALDGTKHAGINRLWWNFRGEGGTQIKLRTKPLYADWYPMPDEGWRSGGGGGFFGGGTSVLQPPGTYTVTLTVDGTEVGSQSLTVLKDPNSEGSLADIQAQTALVEEIVGDLDDAAELVNRIELIRRQLYDLKPVLAEGDETEDLITAADALDEKLIDVEEELIQLKNTGPDGVRWPAMVVGRLRYLIGNVATADFPPTDQHREVHGILKEQLRTASQQLDALLQTDVAAFNSLLRERGVAPVITT